MKLNEFIANVLSDIDVGLKDAKIRTGRNYIVEVTEGNAGVSFDIAVISKDLEGSQLEGHAKAGFVEVLGANVGAKLEDKKENSEVSRIQFKVYVPHITESEEKRNSLYTPRYKDESGVYD